MDLEQTYQKGFDLRCEGRYAEAKPVFQSIVAKDPNHWRSLHQLALIDGFLGDFDGSMAALAKLAVRFPANLDIKYDLAMTQMMLGMYEEACANLKAILAVNPKHENALKQAQYC